MRAGKLRHKITIQENTETRDAAGGYIDGWATFATVRAELNPKIGREYFESDRLNADGAVVFKIRYRAGIVPKMRISWDSRVFDITTSINLFELNKELLIMAVEDV